jgi:hypothetical protein
MRASLKILLVLVLAVLVFAVASRMGWMRSRPSLAPVDGADAPAPVEETAPDVPPVPSSADGAPPTAIAPTPPPLVQSNPVPPAVWAQIQADQMIDEVLASEADSAEKAQKLLEALPTLPLSSQVEAAQHVANLIPNTNYAALTHLITNALTPSDVSEVLTADLLNRPNGLKLPLLLEVARTPGHPWRSEAKSMLELYVQQDFGADWAAWSQAVQDWLKDNPD